MTDLINDIASHLATGSVIPYMGPEMLSLCSEVAVPMTPLALAESMTAKVSVPHKIRKRLTQTAQFIENFKHRKSVVHLMNEAFAATQSEHFGQWTGAYAADGTPLAELSAEPGRLLYKPWGGHGPVGNYLVSDSDYVEVLTEIDIQTPIPSQVQAWRTGRHFLFLGCRFDDQLTRCFARQIMKRSSDRHWAVLPVEPTRMEARFLDEQNITRIPMPLAEFAPLLMVAMQGTVAA